MSVISEKVRTALYTAMNVTAVTDLATGGIYYKAADKGASLPFVIFDRVPMNVDWSMNNSLAGERDRWFIKALADADSDPTKEPSDLCEDILAAIETAIGHSLTVSGQTVSRVQRVADIPPIIEQATDRHIWQHGFQLETFTS
jgi:hypothetical protein